MSGALDRLRSDERGFSLTELLVSIAIGGVILTAALTIFVNGIGSAATVQDRSDAAQRARIGFDRVTSLVGAQVCNGVGTAGAPVTAGDTTSVFFTANVGAVDDVPSGYELRYDAASRSLSEYRYELTGAENAAGYRTWAATWTDERRLLDEVVAAPGVSVFRYWGTDDATTGDPVELGAGGALSASERPRVLRIDVALRVLPTRTAKVDDRTATLMTTQNYVTSNVVGSQLDQGPRC